MKYLSTHEQRLERWLGYETLHIRQAMQDWYGPPITLISGAGDLLVHKGGDITGVIRGGGFTSFDDLVAEATAGKSRNWNFQKVGPTGVIGVTSSLWKLGPQPAAGANASAAPGGNAPTDATTGALLLDNVSTDTRHLVSAAVTASLANTLLLYDRIFQVDKLMSSTATEAVTGVPTRYQSTTVTAADYIGGNFGFVEVGGTALAATAHNWTVCTYTDQANVASTLPSLTGVSGAIIHRLDHPVQQWFAPLETGDVGIKAWTQMQCSASITGVINFVIGHPIAFLPIQVINMTHLFDFVRVVTSLPRIFDDAALAFLEVMKPATGATTYNGALTAVHG